MLKEGAGAVYGSDAIARRRELHHPQGLSTAPRSASNTADSADSDGQPSRSVFPGARAATRRASCSARNLEQAGRHVGRRSRLHRHGALLLHGSVIQGGSSRDPTGRIDCRASAARSSVAARDVTRIEGAAGASLGDYRLLRRLAERSATTTSRSTCILTPQERGSVFTPRNYQISGLGRGLRGVPVQPNDALAFRSPNCRSIRARTTSSSPAQNIYNPFGVDLGGAPFPDPSDPTSHDPEPERPVAYEAARHAPQLRDLGRHQINTGLRGTICDSSWTWDLSAGYGRVDQNTKTDGYLFQPALADAVGPSFIDGTGTPTCGTPTAPICGLHPGEHLQPGCPDQVAALENISADYNQTYEYTTKMASLNFSGRPGGDAGGRVAAGGRLRVPQAVRRVRHGLPDAGDRAVVLPGLPAGERDLQRRLQGRVRRQGGLRRILHPDHRRQARGESAQPHARRALFGLLDVRQHDQLRR